jgi:hypothetical protein
MPRSCRSMCIVAASTSYEAHADRYRQPRQCDTDPAAPRARAAHWGKLVLRSMTVTGLELGRLVAATMPKRLRAEGAVVNGGAPARGPGIDA